jgi:hypothetical protein
MGKEGGIKTFDRSPIYTLAQNGTASKQSGQPQGVYVVGSGAQLSNQKQFTSWAKKKVICQSMMLPLIDIAKEKGAFERVKSYWNAYHCLDRFYSLNDSVHGKYCKNRFCLLCCGIRKAELINKYLPTIVKWPEPFFLTLTVKSAKAEELDQRINEMFALFKSIIQKYKKRNQRGKGIKLIGVKSFESNFNPKSLTYNPHFHLILNDYYTAHTIRNEWIKLGRELWGEEFINEDAQDINRIEYLDHSLIELVKYSSKVFTDPEVRRKKKGEVLICLAAYDNIISAIKKRRIFERFGFNLPKKKKPKSELKLIFDFKEWFYSSAFTDWVEVEGEQVLTGYSPTPELVEILEKKINIHLE